MDTKGNTDNDVVENPNRKQSSYVQKVHGYRNDLLITLQELFQFMV